MTNRPHRPTPTINLSDLTGSEAEGKVIPLRQCSTTSFHGNHGAIYSELRAFLQKQLDAPADDGSAELETAFGLRLRRIPLQTALESEEHGFRPSPLSMAEEIIALIEANWEIHQGGRGRSLDITPLILLLISRLAT